MKTARATASESPTRRALVYSALRVSLVVGTALNLINQGEQVLSGEAVSWFHVLMNYVVPFFVSMFSAAKVKAELKARK
jgi:hypothetical protein